MSNRFEGRLAIALLAVALACSLLSQIWSWAP